MSIVERYTIDEKGDLQKFGSNLTYNRVLYGGHLRDEEAWGRFFTFAGDAPVFMGAASDCLKDNWCYQAKCGVLQSGLSQTPGVPFGALDGYGKWFHKSGDIASSWHHGYMSYELSQFSSYFPETEIALEVYPLQEDDGYLVHYNIIADGAVTFCAVLGGMTNYIGRFDPLGSPVRELALSDCQTGSAQVKDFYGEILHKESDRRIIAGCNFGAALSADSAECAMEFTPTLSIVDHPGEKAVLKFVKPLMPGERMQGDLVVLFNSTPEVLQKYLTGDQRGNIKKAIARKSAGITMQTPDKRLNSTVIDQQIALDAAYHAPTFFHGAIGYHAPFLGWRGWYGGTLAGWYDRICAATRAHLATKQQPGGEEKVWYDGADRPDLDHEGTQYHHLQNSYGKLTAMLYKDDIYDMQEVFVDMVLHYIQRSGDLTLGAEIFDDMSELLAWEERIFDPDNDGLYQSFLNTWISDGHVYNGGGCTQASCYNYAANIAMRDLARKLGRDDTVFAARAEKIRKAVNEILWQKDKGVFAEYIDTIGNKLLHPAPELSTIYLASECGLATAEQMARSLEYTEKNIRSTITRNRKGRLSYSSAWLPKKYSTCGLFPAENAALALAYFANFRKAGALQLLDGLLDVFALSPSPGGISHVSSRLGSNDGGDWDFTDVTSPYLRLLVEGLWGVKYRQLNDEVVIAPQLPDSWESAELALCDLKISYRKQSAQVTLQFSTDLALSKKVIIPGSIRLVAVSDAAATVTASDCAGVPLTVISWTGQGDLSVVYDCADTAGSAPVLLTGIPECKPLPPVPEKFENLDLTGKFNIAMTDIFQQKYLSPRPQGYSIGARINGRYAWEWNHYGHNAVVVNDEALRNAPDGVFKLASSWSFPTPATGSNVCCVSVWENFPASERFDLNGKAKELAIFLMGGTNAMQSFVVNARITVNYTDGSSEVCELIPPVNFNDFMVSALQREFENFYWAVGNHGQVVRINLDSNKELKNFVVEGVANEVIVGILGAALVR